MAELVMSRSASTISFTRSCSEVFCGFQPSLLLALVGSPSSRSTYTKCKSLRCCQLAKSEDAAVRSSGGSSSACSWPWWGRQPVGQHTHSVMCLSLVPGYPAGFSLKDAMRSLSMPGQECSQLSRTSEGRKNLGLMRTTTWPARSPSQTTPTSVTPGGPSQRNGMPARLNAISAKVLHARSPYLNHPSPKVIKQATRAPESQLSKGPARAAVFLNEVSLTSLRHHGSAYHVPSACSDSFQPMSCKHGGPRLQALNHFMKACSHLSAKVPLSENEPEAEHSERAKQYLTVVVSPVPMTKSSGVSCCSMSHMQYT